MRFPYYMFDRSTGKDYAITGQYIETKDGGYITIIDMLGTITFKINDVAQREKDPLKILDIIKNRCPDQEYLKAEKFIYEKFI